MKLGGSVLTDKSRYKTPRPEVIARLAKEIASVDELFVIVHGAGSFGHVLAREHKLAGGATGEAAQRAGAARVHADVRDLGQLVLRALHDAGHPAVWHSTLDLARLVDGRIAAFSWAPILDTLEAGFTPVLSGDVALDASRGFGILSGDVLMVELARAMRPSRATFVTDVDGIFDRNPRDADARLLARIGPQDEPFAGASAGVDVTGGMAGKLARARDVAKTGAPVLVVNGTVGGRVADALAGRAVVGTTVLA